MDKATYALLAARVDGFEYVAAGMVVLAVALEAMERQNRMADRMLMGSASLAHFQKQDRAPRRLEDLDGPCPVRARDG